MRKLFKNGHIIDPASSLDAVRDIVIEDGKVAEIGENLSGDEVIDCSGYVIAPGLVDMHVHMREPGQENKETIATAAQAALAGGVTTILGMPNTVPAADNASVVTFILSQGAKTPVNVLTTGAATKSNAGKEMAEIGLMFEAGITAVSDDAFPVQNSDLMRRVMEYTKMFDLPILLHCEDKDLTMGTVMNEGAVSTHLGLAASPKAAEEIAVRRNIALCELTGCRTHIQHVSCAGSVEAVRLAKSKGIPVTAETCPQYFSLTETELETYNPAAKVNPPLRTPEDVEAVKAGLKDGTLDVIATDHAPHAAEDKDVEIMYAAFGMTGLETSLALSITSLVKTGFMTLPELIALMTAAPAKVLGIDKGTLAPGADGDMVVFDPEEEWTVDVTKFRSKGKNTVLDGRKLTGRVKMTVCGGDVYKF